MKINDIYESTTSGSVATVAQPMTTQARNASIYGGKKGGNLLTGKKTSKKYANSVSESADTTKYKVQIICDDGGKTSYTVSAKTKEEALRKATKFANDDGYEDFQAKIISESNKKPVQEGRMKEIAMDMRDMDNGNFQKKYKKSKEQLKRILGDPDKKPVQEARLEEDDLILVPGQGHRLKSGFIPHGESRLDHEVEMAKSDLFSAAKNAKQVYEMIADISEEEGLEGWVQEKIIKANDYLNTIREYLEGKQVQEMSGGVIAGGAGNIEEESKGLWANIHAKRERIKKGSGERMRKPGSKGAPSAQDFKDSANEGIIDKLKGVVRREKAKDMPLVQTRRDYAMGKGGEAYNKGETRKGNQYMAYAEKDRKKAGDPSDNPAGTYRAKTSDYSSKTIDEGIEDWRTDPMKWHGGSDISWYEHQKQNPIKVKLVNPSKMGGQPKGLYTVKSFNKISPTEAEIVVSHRGQELTGKVDLDNPATHLDKNYDKKRDMEFYSGQRPIAARQAFNLFQTKLHSKSSPAIDEIRYALSPGVAKEYGIDGDTYHKLAKMAMEAKQLMERGLHFDQVVRKMNIPDRLKQTIRDGVYDIRSMAFIMGVQQYQEEQNSVKEGRVLGKGMNPEARARDIEQSDIEYIEQRQFKDKWKKDNPGKPWPGYEKAGKYNDAQKD